MKNFEKEIIEIQNYFFENDKRFSDTTVYNYKGKNLSRIILDLENQILQIMINYFNMKQVNLLTLEYDGLKIYSDKRCKHYSINELENLIFEKSGIKMKLSFKVMENFYPDFGIRVSTDNIIQKNVIENKSKVVHHDHALEKDNILGYICRECNLQIQNREKSVPMLFHNGSNYDNSIILEALSNDFKNELSLNCIGSSSENFKMMNFKLKGLKYSLKLLDSRNFLKGTLSDLSENLPDKCKIVTREHFPDNFELLKTKIAFPFEWLNEENLLNEKLPSIEKFYSKIKLDTITREEYLQTLEIYEKLKCKNIKEFIDIYLRLDICLLTDYLEALRIEIWNEFEIDMTKYITSCSLSKELLFKYTGIKIELFRDINMYDFVNSSIMGGVCIASQNICDNDSGSSVISSCDICSLYPYVMTQKLPIGRYKFVTNFNKSKYGQNKNFGCLLNCEIYTTDKVRNNKILSQFPALISKAKIGYENLSEFQRKNLKDDYKSSEKLVNHLGYDKNAYISFEMYQMLKSLGYKIKVFKILEYQHSNFMKPYIDFLFKKKSYYKSIGNITMSNTYRILSNSLYGIMLLKSEKFKDFKIITTREQADFQVKKFISKNIISENLSIIEMGKTSVVYNSPILIGSIILQNSKVRMYEYLYNIYPEVFGDDIKILYMDTDSIYSKLNMDHEKYKEMIEENSQYFGKNIGDMEPECLHNPI